MTKRALGSQFEHLFAQQKFKGMPSVDIQAVARSQVKRDAALEANRGPLLTANPNQMAFPGMEHLSHPGASFVASGGHFTAHEVKIRSLTHNGNWQEHPGNEIVAHHPDLRSGFSTVDPRSEASLPPDQTHSGSAVGRITWHEGEAPGDLDNAVEMIEVDHGLKHQGIGKALGGVAAAMTRPGSQPGMSKFRTAEGDRWAQELEEKGVVKRPPNSVTGFGGPW